MNSSNSCSKLSSQGGATGGGGGSGENGGAFVPNNNNNTKRRRGDDGHDDNDSDGHGNNNNDAKPDAVVSLEEDYDEDDIDVYVDDGEIPSLAQLARILTFVEAVPVGKFDDKAMERLQLLSGWALGRNVSKEKSIRFKLYMLDLGGLMRMICLIERHMTYSEVVQIASNISSHLTYIPDEMEHNKIWKTSSSRAILSGAMRTLLLASEEVIPSNKEENWSTAVGVWTTICNLCVNGDIKDIDPDILIPIIEENPVQQCLIESTKFLPHKVFVASCFAAALLEILQKHPVTGVNTVRANMVMVSFQEFCCRHMHQIIDDMSSSRRFLGLFRYWEQARIELTDDKSLYGMKKILPFASKALSVHHTNPLIEGTAYAFLTLAIRNIDRRELVNTSLMDDLLTVIRSNNTQDATKTKYQRLMATILL